MTPRAFVAAFRAAAPVSLIVLAGCGSDPAPPPRAPEVVEQPPPPAPRCAADAASEPADARGTMRKLGEDVRRCFLVGSHKDPTTQVSVELHIAESGGVTDAAVHGGESNTAAFACSQKALKNGSFAKFCGNDVTIRWTYTISAE